MIHRQILVVRGKKRDIMKLTLRMIQKGVDNETVAELIELTQEDIEHHFKAKVFFLMNIKQK
ncbi:hypothetical protein [Aneurinibacillus migulanus]|nr:hypothetical protein [Aneurinibacillus migulanus]